MNATFAKTASVVTEPSLNNALRGALRTSSGDIKGSTVALAAISKPAIALGGVGLVLGVLAFGVFKVYRDIVRGPTGQQRK